MIAGMKVAHVAELKEFLPPWDRIVPCVPVFVAMMEYKEGGYCKEDGASDDEYRHDCCVYYGE